MQTHLRLAGRPDHEQRQALEAFIRETPVLMDVLSGLRELRLPDAWLVSGAIYNMVWNRLTGRSPLRGVKDIDLIYFDGSDLSYEAEDVEILRVNARFAQLPLPVELRNQARVHLWFPERFGQEVTPMDEALQSLKRYASRTHAVAARLDENDRLEIEAPFGLDDLFSFRIVPNHVLDNGYAHAEKATRAKGIWPELTVVPW